MSYFFLQLKHWLAHFFILPKLCMTCSCIPSRMIRQKRKIPLCKNFSAPFKFNNWISPASGWSTSRWEPFPAADKLNRKWMKLPSPWCWCLLLRSRWTSTIICACGRYNGKSEKCVHSICWPQLCITRFIAHECASYVQWCIWHAINLHMKWTFSNSTHRFTWNEVSKAYTTQRYEAEIAAIEEIPTLPRLE